MYVCIKKGAYPLRYAPLVACYLLGRRSRRRRGGLGRRHNRTHALPHKPAKPPAGRFGPLAGRQAGRLGGAGVQVGLGRLAVVRAQRRVPRSACTAVRHALLKHLQGARHGAHGAHNRRCRLGSRRGGRGGGCGRGRSVGVFGHGSYPIRNTLATAPAQPA